jgi:hypothetical protein
MEFDEIANGIQEANGNFLRVHPDGRIRDLGFTSPRYQQMVELLPTIAAADLRDQGFDEEMIANILMPNAERKRSGFTKKIETAIEKAAERGRFR